jgi:integrase/recombinase XerD
MEETEKNEQPADTGQPPKQSTWKTVIAKYLDWIRIINFAEDTITVRGRHLKYFASWCEERGMSGPEEVTPEILEHYQRWLFNYRKRTGEPLSTWSQHGRLIAIRGLFRWLAKQKILTYNPASEIDLPKMTGKRLPRVFTSQEAEQVLSQPDVTTPLGIRDRAMIETLYSTGMRRKELANLTLYDLDRFQGIVTIREGKGRKDRVVPIGARAVAWIGKYLEEVRPAIAKEPDEGFIFITSTGAPFHKMHISWLMGQYVKMADIGKNGACHVFRHTMATVMLENGADIRYIQEMLGHVKLTTTQIYTQVSIRKLKEVHTATHPAAKLGRKKTGENQESDTMTDTWRGEDANFAGSKRVQNGRVAETETQVKSGEEAALKNKRGKNARNAYTGRWIKTPSQA